MLLALALLAAPVQETNILGFVYQATRTPPRTLADAERLLLNRRMGFVRPGVYRVTVRTTDGGVTRAEFGRDELTSYLFLRFSGKCEPRDEVLKAFPGMEREPAFPDARMEIAYRKTDWGDYEFLFDASPQHCLFTFRVRYNLQRRG